MAGAYSEDTWKRRSIQRAQQEFRVHFLNSWIPHALFLHLQECEEVCDEMCERDKVKIAIKKLAVGQEQQELQLIFSEFGVLQQK